MSEVPGKFTVPIIFGGADEVPIQHANCFFVSHTDDEFFITFAQAHPPYKLKMTKQEIDEIKRSGLRSRVIARIMVSPIKMKELLDILNENYDKFRRIRKD